MLKSFSTDARFGRSAVRRGATLLLSYGSTLVIVMACFWSLSQWGDDADLKIALGVYLVATIASGIEPGTARAALLAGRPELDAHGLIGATALKALVAAPVLAAIWLFSEHDGIGVLHVLLWVAPLAFIGLLTTNYRNLLDFDGRYATAIWLKQGSLSLALLTLAGGLLADMPLHLVLATSLGLRIVWLWALTRGMRLRATDRAGLAAQVRKWLILPSWPSLAGTSVLASLGGSVDRMVALRFLTDNAAGRYFILYELLSKVWVLSYIAAPILFASRARGGGAADLRKALTLVGAFGVLFIAATLVVAAGILPAELLGVDRTEAWSAVLIAIAFAAAGISQLLVADLQAAGAARSVFRVSSLLLLPTALLFYVLTREFGLQGLAWAWLVRTVTELAVIAFLYRDRK